MRHYPALGISCNKGKGRESVINERQHIKDSLYDWVAAVVAETGRKDQVIWRNENGPRPVPPFISIEFTGSQTPGMPEYSSVETEGQEDDGEQEIRQFVRKAITMYAFGEGAIDLLETIKASVFREKYIAMLYKAGLVIPQVLDVTETPAPKSNEIENSAFFDFVVTFIRVGTDVPGWIGGISMSSDTPIGDIDISTPIETEEVNG